MPLTELKNRPGHSLFWLGGVMVAILPYVLLFVTPEWRAPWILPPGRFVDNLAIATRHLLLGATLGGWLWFLLNRVNPFGLISKWWRRPCPLNWVWYSFSLLIYTIHNTLLLFHLPFSPVELVAACLGRFLTALIVLTLLWLGAHVASLAAPTRFRLLPWLIPASLPGFLGADAASILLWKNSLRYTLNKIDEEGSVNLARQLTAGGIDTSPLLVVTMIIGFIALLCLLCYGSAGLSKLPKLRIRLRPRFVLVLLSLAWVGLATEKAFGFAWKSRKALRMEHHSYDVHLTPIRPNPGVASFSAAWKPAHAARLVPTAHPAKPDIFFIMLESTRDDLLKPEHTPFLCRFRDEECQQLGITWSASNATHLSWFSIFNGQLPSYWGDAMDVARTHQSLARAPFFDALDLAGYQMEARTVCDLAYNGMASTNFGLPHGLDVLVEAGSGHELEPLSVPERELSIIAQAKAALGPAPSSGNFHFIALDSPHFGYHWHPDFQVPYTEFDPEARFHAYPDENDIQRVKNRYFNALAWTDHLLEDFVDFLKAQNRYDHSLIIITGDHGEEFHEHGSWFHCSSLEREQTRVPILIKWPDGMTAPAHVSASHLDILPTLLDFLDQPTENFAHLPGRSLLEQPMEEATQLTLTSFCGITGIAMTWQRDGFTASFRWDNPWATGLPETIYLEDIQKENQSLNLHTEDEWEQALRLHFPDAPHRFFSRFERIETKP